MPEYKIQITSDAGQAVQAANQAAAALNQTAAAVAKAADESERYQAALRAMASQDKRAEMLERQAEAAKMAAEADKEIAEGVKVVGKEEVKAATETVKGTSNVVALKKQWKDAMQAIGREFPILGAAGRLALNPIAAATTLAVFGLNSLRKSIQQMQESLSTAEWESYEKVVKAAAKAQEDARFSASAYRREMEGIKSALETASESQERYLTVFKARQKAEDQVDEARKRLDLAKASGIQDPARRAAEELRIEEVYAQRKKRRADEEAQVTLQESFRKLANEQIAGERMDAEMSKLEKRQAAMKSEAQIEAQLANERGRLAATDAEIAKKRERYEQLQATPWIRRWSSEQAEMNILGGDLEQLGSVRMQQEDYVRRLEARRPGQIEEARSVNDRLGQLRSGRSALTQRMMGLAGMIPTMVATTGIEQGARTQEAGLDSLSRAYSLAGTARGNVAQISEEITKAIQSSSGIAVTTLQKLQEWEALMRQMQGRIRSLEGTRDVSRRGL